MKLSHYWVVFIIISFIINILSIKGFPLALGTLYLPVLFKVVQLQLNLSNGLVSEDVTAQTFIQSNQKGIVISVICCIAITVALYIYLDDFYNQLTGFLGSLIILSPVTLVIGLILYILSAISVVQAVKLKYQ
ncbi:hypothetical protein DOS68_05325 [Staphylococcus felis]|uniref:Uncharacterized protein n=1 Tax=Staphylococcus felis TaxID=46127 RepID=A0A3E0IHT1_9STAP|nr:hypothetical protein [Staphylococcus felis]MBH9580153.1 hypothetical protein [Staphylococcus felis]MDM8328189.1 hypothetical protein [Staphylococcus felis]MDQ7192936.1 hypothetical protein [Staphylococcus felis]REH76863.1 hypothetical protein DOS57_07520 [Staphylococcus felis]REH77931.1 hypothetical protein DOS60_04680 [Staphylococcus felis]